MLNPLMLMGLLGLSVPILIHLINRRRMRPFPLATLKFLDQKDVANTFAPVPRDVIQLLLRLILLALFILLMARMTGPSDKVGPRTVSIILDSSMSMKRLWPNSETNSLFDVHRDRILKFVEGMEQGDFFSFILVGDKVFEHTGFVSDPEVIRRADTEAWVSDGSGRSLYLAIEDSVKALRSRRAPNTVLMVFSDQQLENYRSHLEKGDLAKLLEGTNIRTAFVMDPLEVLPNVELRSAEFNPPRNYLGAFGKVTASLKNTSEVDRNAVVTLKSGVANFGSRSFGLSAGETALVELKQDFQSTQDSPWTVDLSEDGFNADNQYYTTVRMLSRPRVLLVRPPSDTAPDAQRDPNAMLDGPELLALAANPAEETGGTYISVKVIDPSELVQMNLAQYSTVVLYGIQDLGAPGIVQDLVAYARQGGGIYIIADRGVNPMLFNEKLDPLLSGFRLGAFLEPDKAAALDTKDDRVQDPLLVSFLRGEWGTVEDIVVTGFFGSSLPGGTKVALRTKGGDILVAAAALGKGSVCLQTFGWAVKDSSFPRTRPFVSVVQAILDRFSVRDNKEIGGPDHIRVGDFHQMSLPSFRGLAGAVVLDGPRKESFEMPLEGSRVSIKDMYAAGNYRANHPGKANYQARWLAVNPALEESNATFASGEQLASLCGAKGEVVATSDRLDGLFQPSRELYPILLVLVLIALLVEALGPVLFPNKRKDAHEPGT